MSGLGQVGVFIFVLVEKFKTGQAVLADEGRKQADKSTFFNAWHSYCFESFNKAQII